VSLASSYRNHLIALVRVAWVDWMLEEWQVVIVKGNPWVAVYLP
jgi:hypothetical protein